MKFGRWRKDHKGWAVEKTLRNLRLKLYCLPRQYRHTQSLKYLPADRPSPQLSSHRQTVALLKIPRFRVVLTRVSSCGDVQRLNLVTFHLRVWSHHPQLPAL